MKRKEHTSTKDSATKDRIVVSAQQNGTEHTETSKLKSAVPNLTLAQQQELTGKIMTRIKKARQERVRFSRKIITLRDIVTCTDSFLIRASAYALVILLILGLVSSVFFIFSAITSQTLLHHAGFSLSKPVTSVASSPNSPAGKILYNRSREAFLLSQT